MDLKTRKQINNLPKYSGGFNPIQISFDAETAKNNVGDLPNDRASWYSRSSYDLSTPEGRSDAVYDQTNFKNRLNEPDGHSYTLPPQTVDRKNDAISPSTASGINGIGPAFQMTYNAANNYKTQEELFNQQPRSTQYAFGQQYQRIQDIDKSKEMDAVNSSTPYEIFLQSDAGAKIGGGIMPGWGHLIGGVAGLGVGAIASIFKTKNAKRALDAAQKKITDINTYNYDLAATSGIQQEQAERYGVKNGKDAGDTMGGRLPKFFSGKGVNTAYGIMPGEPNALTNKGEEILDTETGIMSHVGRGPNDTAPSYLRGKDAVITTNDGLAKKARMYYNRGDMAGVASVLQEQQMNHMLGKYKNGRLPRFEDGGYIDPWANITTNGMGAAASIWQMIDAYRQQPHKPESYVNPYDAQALRDMAGARYDLYPIAQMLLKDRARTDRALDMSGGLSGAQRYLGKVSNGANYYNAITDAMMRLGQGNISLRQAYNQARINSAANAAKQRQQAYQWDYDMFTKAHGARQQGIQMGLRNAMDYMNNYAANEFKRQQANYMLGLYDQQLSNDQYDLYMRYKNK